MERLNSEGVPLRLTLLTLQTPHLVRDARNKDRCFLCQRPKVNQAGLCDYCYSQLDGEELRVATQYMDGIRP